jgi:transposase
MWAPIGEPCTVPSAGQNRRVPVFGALDARSGKLVFLLTERKRSAEFIAFLRLLLATYRDKHLFLFLDNCSIHYSKAVRRFLADRGANLTIIWNAPYTPELNLIERYWGHLKAKAINNYFFGTVEELESAVRQAVRDFNRSPTLRMKCNLGFMRSLRKVA